MLRKAVRQALCGVVLNVVEFLIPFGKLTKSGAKRRIGFESRILFKCRRIRISHGHITRLHGYKLLMRFKVVIGRQDIGTYE